MSQICSTLTHRSINSIDELLNSEEFSEKATTSVKEELEDRIIEILDGKRRSLSSREECLASYNRLLTAHHLGDVLFSHTADLIVALSKTIEKESSEKETLLALKALSLTVISKEDESVFWQVASKVKRLISNSSSLPTKAAALHCLGTCAFFARVGGDEMSALLDFLLGIVSSDGGSVEALDDAGTVTAAIQNYAFLATIVDDVEEESDDAVEAFAEQLESEDTDVVIAAGEAIALLYEKSYGGEDDSSDDEEAEGEEDRYSDEEGPPVRQRYSAYHHTGELIRTLQSLASISTKRINRKNRRDLHESFTSILRTVERPNLGIQYRSSRHLTVRIHTKNVMKIDRWWKLIRLNALRRLLTGGFVNHYYEGNKQVLQVLPVLLRSIDREKEDRNGGRKSNKGKYESRLQRDDIRVTSSEI